MTVEQLMQPRYKVIAEDTSQNFEIGDLLTPFKAVAGFENHWVTNHHLNNKRHIMIYSPEKYPHLFRKLQWWEERDEKDMPEYVKDEYGVYKVMNNWYELNSDGCCSAHTFRDNKFYAKDVHPATEQQYNDYINQLKP